MSIAAFTSDGQPRRNRSSDMYIHGTHVRDLPDGGDAVVAKVHRYHPDGTMEPVLRVFKNPPRKFYVTKEGARVHTGKRQSERLQNLVEYVVPNHMLEYEVHRALHGWVPKRRPRLRELCKSPYLYGADIDIQTLIKHKINSNFEKSGYEQSPVTTGFFDTETRISRDKHGEVMMATVNHGYKVYSAVVRDCFYKIENGVKIPGDLEEFSAYSRSTLDPIIDKILKSDKYKKLKLTNEFEYHYYVAEDAMDLLRWVIGQIHRNKTDFVGVWNEKFDIEVVLKMCEKFGVAPEDLFCPGEEDLPKEYRKLWWVVDTKKVDHFTKKWHWLHTSGYAQFYDAMCLYSNLRIGDGKEASYSLDAVLEKAGVGGKLKFKGEDAEADRLTGTEWHRHMQEKEPYKYLVYNQWDVISLQIMEWGAEDVQSMYLLSGPSSLSKYVRQTKKVSDSIYFDWLEDGHVLGTTSPDMTREFDWLIKNEGGAVARPERMDNVGIHIFVDAPHIRANISPFTNDIDFSAMYPHTKMACNVSLETKVCTAVSIQGACVYRHFSNDNYDHIDFSQLTEKQAVAVITPHANAVEWYHSYMVSPRANAVELGKRFFNLPGFEEMEDLVLQELSGELEALSFAEAA